MSTLTTGKDTFQRRLSPTARQVLTMLVRTAMAANSNQIQVTDREISEDVGKARRTVQYALHDLRRAGLIRCDLFGASGTKRTITLL